MSNKPPLRLTHAWDLQRIRDDKTSQPGYVKESSTRYGMLTGAGGGTSKCMACQEIFPTRNIAKGHICKWEQDFREATGRRMPDDPTSDLEERVAKLEHLVETRLVWKAVPFVPGQTGGE